MLSDDAHARLAARCRAIPGHLGEVLRDFRAPPPPRAGEFVVTGGGLSEGPARFFAALLVERGVRASYLPLSEFYAPELSPRDQTLVLFSQGLAPNARLPLRHQESFRDTIIFTSVRADPAAPEGDVRALLARSARRGAQVIALPPAEESGLLLRVIGPPVAALAAALYVRALAGAPWEAHLAQLPEKFAAAFAAPPLDLPARGAALALVAGGRYARLCHGLGWKLLEGLRVPAPPIWDHLQIAHGPLQSFYDGAATLIALERPDAPHEPALLDRLAEVLAPERHRILRARATLPSPLAWFEHDAQLDALVLAAARARGLALDDWPARGQDGPLYDIEYPPRRF